MAFLLTLRGDVTVFGLCCRSVTSEGEADTAQFLSKQETLWKGFVNMLNVARFVTKGYLVSGSAELIKRVQYSTTASKFCPMC